MAAAFALEAPRSLLLGMVVLATADRKASIGTRSALAVTGTLALAHMLGVHVASGRAGAPVGAAPGRGARLRPGLGLARPGAPGGAEAARGDQEKGDKTGKPARGGQD